MWDKNKNPLCGELNLEPTRPNGLVGCKVPTDLVKISVKHWNGNVFILMKFSSLAALKVVKMTTSSAASDENFIKMTTFSFQWRSHAHGFHYIYIYIYMYGIYVYSMCVRTCVCLRTCVVFRMGKDRDPGPLFTKRTVLPQNLMKSRSTKIGFYNDRIVLKFDRHLGSAADMLVKFHSDWKRLNPKFAASRLHEILL